VDDPLGWLRARFPEIAVPASLADGEVAVDATHTVSGNPLRFTTGPLTIRSDTAWQTEMRPRHRRVVTGATLPFLVRYGYV
jgi:hypothetical protein